MPTDSKQLVVLLILGIWFIAGIATVATKDSGCLGCAVFISLCIGLAYCLRHC